ncbi:MAG: redox-regulated ATPase YchF [bacterium]|nr:redox-regulated ATPase YchF [bacterium]
MALSLGIVGLPNVGKSTLFNALVKNAQAQASNYPFCTIDPNVGVVQLPDERLEKLSEISKSKQIVPTTVEFTDIAGLVQGAHHGEGLGNQFLSHIRQTDAIAMVVRFFEDKDIVHVAGAIDPVDDIHVINLELILADLAVAEKRLEALKKETKSGDAKAKKRVEIMQKIKDGLDREIPVRQIFPDPNDLEPIKDIQFITSKPVIYIANVSEGQASITSDELIKHHGLQSILQPTNIQKVIARSETTKQSIDCHASLAMTKNNLILISAKIEAELSVLAEKEQQEYLESLGLHESGLNRLIEAAYETLGLITFFTSGEKETRAWTVLKGSSAPVAAGKIHKDFEKGFIAADVIKYNDFIKYNGWQGTKEKGLIKTEGKQYVVQDGDVILFKFNV